MFQCRLRHHKALSTDQGKLVCFTWVQLLRHLMKSTIHHNSFNILEAVFFHPIFPNRPQELCSQNTGEGILIQDVRDLTAADVIRGCAQVVGSQPNEDEWSTEPVSMVIKDGKYLELDFMALTRFPKLFPGGTTAVVFSKVAGKAMKPGVYVHEIKRSIEVDKDEIRCEGFNVASYSETRLREYTWALLKVIENQIQAKCVHFIILYKLTIEDEEPYIAYVVKCVAKPFTALQKRGHYRNNSTNWKSPLNSWMQSTSLLKSHKPMKFDASLRTFVVNPTSGMIIQPKETPQSEDHPVIQRSLSHLIGSSPALEPTTTEPDKSDKFEKVSLFKKKDQRHCLRKRGLLPLLKRDESDFLKSMELHGTGFPWRHAKLDLTLD